MKNAKKRFKIVIIVWLRPKRQNITNNTKHYSTKYSNVQAGKMYKKHKC